jgi:carotenoid cleavage dioxygenase-like enzyme
MPTEIIRRVASDITPGDHPYLQGAWTPLHEEVNATEMRCWKAASRATSTASTCATPRTRCTSAIGRYHPFDGDGMIHMIHFKDGQASYRNRFVDTKGLRAEQEAGHRLWAGLMEDPKLSERPGWGAHGSIKDASSTDVVVHAGKALTSYYQCGEGYRHGPAHAGTAGHPAMVAPGRHLGPHEGGRSHRRTAVLQLLETRALHALRRRGPPRQAGALRANPAAGPAPAARHGLHRTLCHPQ